MKRVLDYMIAHWYYYLVGVLAMIVGLTLDMYAPIITGRLIDEVIINKDIALFSVLIWMLIGITLGRGIFGYIKEIAFDLVGARVIKKLRKSLFDHIQSLSQNFFQEKNTGELMTRLKDDGDKIWESISFGIMLTIEMTIMFVVVVILMLRIHVQLALFTFMFLPAIGYLAYKLNTDIRRIYGKISKKNAQLNTTAQENIAGVRLVKAFAREKYEAKRFLKQSEGYYELNMTYARAIARRYPNMLTISALIPVFVVVIGGYFVIGQELTLGVLAEFLGYAYMIVWPMRLVGWLSSIMAEAKAAGKRIDEIFEAEPVIYNAPDAKDLGSCQGEIEFKHVDLILGKKSILKDINFTLKQGETLAIMGATGSGKTSIVNLLERFYDPDHGQVLIDGKDIRTLTLKSLRQSMAVVMQEVFLFSDSIGSNISFGNEREGSAECIEESATQAQAHDFISQMSQNYATVIGERGIGLSGGQKQRISIARAFDQGAKIIVMDDATSALDTETEYRIQKEVKRLKDRTKIIIGHRISAVKEADEIIVLDQGEIIERGTHQALLALKGCYFDTFSEQYEGYIEEGA